MAKYRKKPVVIEALQLNTSPASLDDCMSFIESGGGKVAVDFENETHYLKIATLEGTMKASVDDWIIKGVKGEFYPCKPDIFEATYELAE